MGVAGTYGSIVMYAVELLTVVGATTPESHWQQSKAMEGRLAKSNQDPVPVPA